MADEGGGRLVRVHRVPCRRLDEERTRPGQWRIPGVSATWQSRRTAPRSRRNDQASLCLCLPPPTREFSVGLTRIELVTSSLSGTRSNRLSYSPEATEQVSCEDGPSLRGSHRIATRLVCSTSILLSSRRRKWTGKHYRWVGHAPRLTGREPATVKSYRSARHRCGPSTRCRHRRRSGLISEASGPTRQFPWSGGPCPAALGHRGGGAARRLVVESHPRPCLASRPGGGEPAMGHVPGVGAVRRRAVLACCASKAREAIAKEVCLAELERRWAGSVRGCELVILPWRQGIGGGVKTSTAGRQRWRVAVRRSIALALVLGVSGVNGQLIVASVGQSVGASLLERCTDFKCVDDAPSDRPDV